MNDVICMEGVKTILRPVNPETDFDTMWRAINDLSITQFLNAQPPITAAKEKEYLENIGKDENNIIFAMCDKSSGQFIGTMGLHRINWKLRQATTGSLIADKQFWRKGYGFDAKVQLLNYGFNYLNLHRVNSAVLAFNKRSAGCLLKCGYKEEGIRRQYYFCHGQYVDQVLFGILKPDFDPIWEQYSKSLNSIQEEQEKN